MRLPDPFTHPGRAPGFQTAKLVDNNPLVRDQMPNGKVYEVHMAGQYWGVEVTYPDLYESEYRLIESFIQNYKRLGSFIDILLPQYQRFTVGGTPNNTTIPAGQSGSLITINNANMLSGTPREGDLFKLSTHPKVYRIVYMNLQGNRWDLGLYPDLHIITNGSEKPVFSGITIQTKILNADSFGQALDADGMYTGLSLNLREAI